MYQKMSVTSSADVLKNRLLTDAHAGHAGDRRSEATAGKLHERIFVAAEHFFVAIAVVAPPFVFEGIYIFKDLHGYELSLDGQ